MKFKKIAIMGVGLLGGSLALAIRKKKIAQRLSLYVRREESLAAPRSKGFEVGLDPLQAVEGADLVILSTPQKSLLGLVKNFFPALSKDAIVTDVTSVKEVVVAEMEKEFKDKGRWVGSHPMAGGDQSGFDFARENLFKGATVVVTPTKESEEEAVEDIQFFWELLESNVVLLSPKKHDELVSKISHVPHLVAAAMAQIASKKSLALVGSGFKDTTRIAQGNTRMWKEILLSNANFVSHDLEVLIDVLKKARIAIKKNDHKALEAMLLKGKRVREGIDRV